MDVAAEEGLETLAMRELHVQRAAVALYQREGAELALVALIVERAAAAFQPKARTLHQAQQERIAYLEQKIQRKDEVLAEMMAEHLALKKSLGEL